MKWTVRSLPLRAAQLGGAAACGLGAWGLAFAGGMAGDIRLLAPAAGCAAASLYMFKEAVVPERDSKD